MAPTRLLVEAMGTAEFVLLVHVASIFKNRGNAMCLTTGHSLGRQRDMLVGDSLELGDVRREFFIGFVHKRMERCFLVRTGVGYGEPTVFMNATNAVERDGMRAMDRTHVRCYHVGKGTWKPSMSVPMVVVGRGKHVVGYSLLAIKSIG